MANVNKAEGKHSIMETRFAGRPCYGIRDARFWTVTELFTGSIQESVGYWQYFTLEFAYGLPRLKSAAEPKYHVYIPSETIFAIAYPIEVEDARHEVKRAKYARDAITGCIHTM